MWTKPVLILNWIVWIRTVWLNWINWNRNVFDNQTVYLLTFKLRTYAKLNCVKQNYFCMQNRNRTDYLYEIDLALNNLQRLICYKIQQTNQPTNQPLCAGCDIRTQSALQFFHSWGGEQMVTCLCISTNPFARAGYDTRLIFKQSLTGFNSEFSFS